MTDLHHKIILNNNVEYVFDKLFSHPEYREWSSAFKLGYDYEGVLQQGEELFFRDKMKNGMICLVSDYQINKSIEFTHLTAITDGERFNHQPGNFERYTFTNLSDELMMLDIHLRLPGDWAEMMTPMWEDAVSIIIELFDNDYLL
ncbi:hypothetical protein RZE82_04595 [Mollicutes bacterium LVI A0039]|nr:hypothetical protein RZE82_04595 [Mollicutes bacterium LVI A0039]